jgi:SAM-dependent MidA family methyltransferase
MAGSQKFGSSGDFITAPEISPLFGLCLASQCRQVLQLTGGHILELGAGSGKLAAAVIEGLSDQQAVLYYILEPSAELQQRQQESLSSTLSPEQFARVQWISELPNDFIGVCIANEVMDALPVELFTVHEGQAIQVCVQQGASGYEYVQRPAPSELAELIDGIENDVGVPFAAGYRSEVCKLLNPWVSALAHSLKHGALLLSDYGYPRREYYLPERLNGTLSCFYQHRTHDNPFFCPGLQDITAHVDFTRVVEAGAESGLDLLGYTSQASFLLDTGLLSISEPLFDACANEQERISLARQIKTLTLPGEMGERFQFMALGKNLNTSLQGFATQDLSHRL